MNVPKLDAMLRPILALAVDAPVTRVEDRTDSGRIRQHKRPCQTSTAPCPPPNTVTQRRLDFRRQRMKALATGWRRPSNPGHVFDFNQALMDLGAGLFGAGAEVRRLPNGAHMPDVSIQTAR